MFTFVTQLGVDDEGFEMRKGVDEDVGAKRVHHRRRDFPTTAQVPNMTDLRERLHLWMDESLLR